MTRLHTFVALSFLAVGCLGGPNSADIKSEADDTKTARVEGDQVGEITKIHGVAGIRSPELPKGAFLGEGARLEAGQTIEVPRGTRAEIRLADGTLLRVNEQSELTLPSGTQPYTASLRSGEVVVRVDASSGFKVRVDEEVLSVGSGEVQIATHDGQTRYAVLDGNAELEAGDQKLAMGPGETLDTPFAEGPTPPKPTVSIASIETAAWSTSFDAAKQMTKHVRPGVGSLTARRPNSRTERQTLRIVDQKVTVDISGRIARTEIEQAFHNDAAAVLEGTYRFPLPTDASISDLQLLVGQTWMRGEMLEKQRARRIFKSLVDVVVPRDPALLEWERGNVFKLKVFPIPGRGERRIKLAYTQVLPVEGDKLRYRYPMGGSGSGDTRIENFDFRVRVDGSELSPQASDGISTPMVDLRRTTEDGHVVLAMHEDDYTPTHELGVDVPVSLEDRHAHSETYVDRDGQGYFMLSLQPKIEVPEVARPVHYAFVMDRSHGITPELWTLSRGVVETMVDSMGSEDRFTVLACDTACDEVPTGMTSSAAGVGDRIDAFLNAQILAGASDVGAMLEAGTDALREAGDADVERVVVYLGDGVPSSGAMTPDALRTMVVNQLNDVRVQAVALGSRSDMLTLDAITRTSGGDLLQADPRDDLRLLARQLRVRARVPVARDVHLDLPPELYDVHPKRLPGLRPGDSVTVLGKFRPGASMANPTITLRSRGVKGEPKREDFTVGLDLLAKPGGKHAHLPRTWAQEEIEWLTATQGARAKANIIALSRSYTVLSRWTALLVLENDRMYREFNVVRNATKKDAWKGNLEANRSSNLQRATGSTPAGTVTSKLGKVGSTTEAQTAATPDAGGDATGLETKSKNQRDQGAKDEKWWGANEGAPASTSTPAPPMDEAEAEDEMGEARAVKETERSKRRGEETAQPVAEDPAPPAEVAPEADAEPPRLADRNDGDNHFERGNANDLNGVDSEKSFLDEEIGDDKDDDLLLGGAGTSSGASSGSGGRYSKAPPASKPRPTKKPKKKAGASKPSPYGGFAGDGFGEAVGDPFSGNGGAQIAGGGRGGGKKHPGYYGRHPVKTIKSRGSRDLSQRSLDRVAALQTAVVANDKDRRSHAKLVKTATYLGHPQAPAFAAAWAEADPDSAAAMTARADQLAAQGHAATMRAYASAIEVDPFDEKRHQRIAEALARKGDLRRACSHRRATVSLDPKSGKNHAALIDCLAAQKNFGAARRAAADGAAFASKDVKAVTAASTRLNTGDAPKSATLHSSPDVRVTVTWTGDADLDAVLVDSRGRRLSAVRPERVRVREGAGRDELTLKKFRSSLYVEVTRFDDHPGAVEATVVVKTRHGKRTYHTTLTSGTQRIAKIYRSY